MNKKTIATSILLSICLIFTGVGISPSHAAVSEPDKVIKPSQIEAIEPHSIGHVSVQLERRNATTLSYRVSSTSISGINTSMSATIVPQRLENGRWVNRGSTITHSVTNALWLDAAGTIDVRAHGSGTYRILVTFRAVNSGITTVFGPIESFTVNL